MPKLLRKSENKKWLPLEKATWLSQGDIQADPVGDLATKGNTLSLYELEDGQANLNRIIAALAATRGNVQHFEYTLIERSDIESLGIKIKKTKGMTADEGVNDCHYDLFELSGYQIVSLAKMIFLKGARTQMLKDDVRKEIIESVRQGYLNQNLEAFKAKNALMEDSKNTLRKPQTPAIPPVTKTSSSPGIIRKTLADCCKWFNRLTVAAL